MKRFLIGLATLGASSLVGTPVASGQAPASSRECSRLAELRLEEVRITAATRVDSTATGGGIRVPHCRVEGVIEKEIRFEVLLPEEWNGRFLMGGGGGFVGSIQNSAAAGVNLGFASAGTDTGHSGSGISAEWALGHPERIENFGHRAVHRTAETAKAVIAAYYGSRPGRSYFMGCSRGGGQAMMEAQRYPDDFDGIVAGAPAFDWTGAAARGVQSVLRSFVGSPGGLRPVLTRDNLRLLEARVLAACDGLDGVRDGVMVDPRACRFDLASIRACPGDAPAADCLTRAQRDAIERVYAPATSRGRVIYPGQPFGGEGAMEGWTLWITGSLPGASDTATAPPVGVPSLHWAFATQIFKYLVYGDSTWDYTRYDMSRWENDTRAAAAVLNADSPDMDAFRARGGKLILWHGWADPALPATRTIQYYEAVEARDPRVRDYARLYMLPGVLHCGGGAGPDQVDWVQPLVGWVERGEAPERIIAAGSGSGGTPRSRPLCPYPQRAVYAGTGSTDEAQNFVCSAP